MLRPPSKNAGFTLLELMFVVALIGVLAAAAYPGMSDVYLSVKVSSATSKLIRIGKYARARAHADNVAHTIAWFVDDEGDENMAVFRGDVARCNSVLWPTLDQNAPHEPDYRVDAGLQMFTNGGRLRLLPNNPIAGALQICVQPDGTTMYRNGNGGVFTPTLNGVADFRIDVYSEVGGGPQGVVRQVVFPNGTAPRSVQ